MLLSLMFDDDIDTIHPLLVDTGPTFSPFNFLDNVIVGILDVLIPDYAAVILLYSLRFHQIHCGGPLQNGSPPFQFGR